MTTYESNRVGVNGYGAIGKRVADGVLAQDDMTLAGVAEVARDWRPVVAVDWGIRLSGADPTGPRGTKPLNPRS